MKRLLPFIPIFLLVVLDSCNVIATSSGYPPEIQTSVIQTHIATAWTITPVSTTDPYLRTITESLNRDLSVTDPLGQIIDATYTVTDAYFQSITDNTATAFVIDVLCDCAGDTECCTPPRTFDVIANSMKKDPIQNQILAFVDPNVGRLNVTEMKVICTYKGTKIGAMSAPWFYTKEYLVNNISGYQFGVRISSSKP